MISTKTVYAMCLILDLTVEPQRATQSAEDLARKHGLSAKYMGVVASLLRKNGILEGKPGMGGGFRLARDPSAITLADVLVATEGYLQSGVTGLRDSPETRVVARAIKQLSQAWLESASQITFQQILDEYRDEATARAQDFVI